MQPAWSTPLPSSIAFQQETIQQMRTFVYEVLDQHQATDFYDRYRKQLKGDFIYSFRVVVPDLSWRLHKRLFDFQEFSRKIVQKCKRPDLALGITKEPEAPCVDTLRQLRTQLEKWSKQPQILSHFNEFIENSGHNYEGFEKYKEMYVYKRSGGRYQESCVKCGALFKNWKIRYFIIHSQGIIYKDEVNSLREYITYDYDFHMRHGKAQTGSEKGIVLETSHRKLYLEALSHFGFLEFVYNVKQGLKNSEYASLHRYNSFAPIRKNCELQFYVDGEDYYKEVALTMLSAKKEIFIAGWWVSPQFQMIRPVNEQNEKYRLDKILQAVASKGVKISVLVYFESTFLENDSNWTKTCFQQLNPVNIKVLRHPVTVMPFLWSHHEKVVIIDQQIAFTGGLDLCYARFDTSDHLLYDYKDDMYPGIDYNNIRRQDIVAVKEFDAAQYQKSEPRLPWHDVACSVRGSVVWDLSLHFIQYWNYASHQIQLNNKNVLVREAKTPASRVKLKLGEGLDKMRQLADKLKEKFRKKEEPHNRFDKYFEQIKGEEPPLVEAGPSHTLERFPNVSARANRIYDLFMPKARHSVPNSLPSDIAINKPASQLRYHGSLTDFPEEREKENQGPHPNIKQRFLKLLNNLKPMEAEDKEEIVQFKERSLRDLDDNVESTGFIHNKNPTQTLIFRHNSITQGQVECQVVRSASAWSIGCSPQSTEFSVQIAYLELIATSKHYIYIENQFFISSCADEKNIKNQIANTLVQRILQAHEKKEEFRIYVLLPLLPGFAGEVYDSNATIMKLNLHWEYQTICRSRNSMLKQLDRAIGEGNWRNYIQFLSLRTHGRISEEAAPCTEIIYLHSKLMIVDDETVIVGSANINDRSMKGKRDSEICVVSNDKRGVVAWRNGKQVEVRKTAYELRAKLWKEHFGIRDAQQLDPVSSETWEMIRRIAQTNTDIYRTVFGCYPDDYIRNYSQITSLKERSQPEKYLQLMSYVRASVVEFPLRFLQDEDLNVKITQKEYVMPITLST